MSKPNAGPATPNEHQCRAEDCKKKPERAHFCNEHFMWFKWGLISADGTKARDFDKKYQGYLKKGKTA